MLVEDSFNEKVPAAAHLPTGEATTFFDGHKDDGKMLFACINPEFEKAIAEVLTFGATKYAIDSYRTVPDGEKRFMGSILRHVNAYRGGQKLDPESGLHHLAHVATNLMFVMWLEANNAS